MILENQKKKIIRYMQPKFLLFITGCILLILSAAMTVILIDNMKKTRDDNGVFIGFIVFTSIFGLITVSPFLSSRVRLKNQIKRFEKQGILDAVISDFENGKKYLKNQIILGNNFIFCKSADRIILYDEVTRVYQHVNYVNGFESSRKLKFNVGEKVIIDACDISKKAFRSYDDTKKEMLEVCAIIAGKNPNTKFGAK